MLFRQMEYFLAVVEQGSFYGAAEACHVSQSAVSQQIARLEGELGFPLLERHNRTFTLTPAGEYFYRRCLIVRADVDQTLREARRIASKGAALRLGCYMGYHGDTFSEAVAAFSEKYPGVDVSVVSGSHEDLYRGMEAGEIDLALNDQRRAFSGAYNNVVLSESATYVELSARSPLSRLPGLEAADLKALPCILVAGPNQREEERRYYDEVVGLHGEFLFADSPRDARLKIITGRGYQPVDVFGEEAWFDTAVARVPLVRNGEPIRKVYCAFWRKDSASGYVEPFAELLKGMF